MSTNTQTPAGHPARMSSARRTAYFAYAAGVTGILANLFLIVMYVLLGLQAGRPEAQTLLGSAFHVAGAASDLLGSLATAFMIPVALFLGGCLPRRRAVRFAQASGLTVMALLTVGGPLLVLGVLTFEVETPIAIVALIVLAIWLLLVNRWLRLLNALSYRVCKVGRASWHRLPGRVRDRGAWSLAALDVLAAACGVRLRRPRRAARLPCWHPGVVPAPGPAPREILTIFAKSKLRRPSFVARVTQKTIFR